MHVLSRNMPEEEKIIGVPWWTGQLPFFISLDQPSRRFTVATNPFKIKRPKYIWTLVRNEFSSDWWSHKKHIGNIFYESLKNEAHFPFDDASFGTFFF